MHCFCKLQTLYVAIFCSIDKVYVADHFTINVHTINFFQLDDCLEIVIKNPLNSKLNLTFLWVFERTLLFSSDFFGYWKACLHCGFLLTMFDHSLTKLIGKESVLCPHKRQTFTKQIFYKTENEFPNIWRKIIKVITNPLSNINLHFGNLSAYFQDWCSTCLRNQIFWWAFV